MRLSSRGLLAVVGLASFACGGRVDPGDDGGAPTGSSTGGSGSSTGSGSSSGSVGSSSGVTVPPCPSEPPTPGMRCVAPGQQGCAYFTKQGCESFLCNGSSLWQSTPEGC